MSSSVGFAMRPVFVLVVGVVAGGLAAGALVFAVADAVRGDAPTEAAGAPSFVEDSADAGLDQVYDGEFQFFVGGGVAVFDCNSDLLPDLYIAGGTGTAGLFVNRSDVGGSLMFERITAPETDIAWVTGAYPIDVDSDGKVDLAVLRVGENVMLRGQGDCEFEPANQPWGLDGGDDWTASFSATWEEGESLPTLAFGNYLALDDTSDGGECADHHFFRPRGGTYADPTPLSPGWCTLSILFSDWDRSGSADLRMTNDRHYYRDGQEQLWRVDPDAAPALYTQDEGWKAIQIWGMGIATHDLTGDGMPEVFLTSQGDNKLQTLTDETDRPSYEDVALSLGATAHRPFIGDTTRPSTAWHAEFGDVNNDGFTDLFVTKGNVDSMAEFAMDDPNNLLLGQPDGRFVEGAAAADIIDYARSRGGALVDLNLDGRLDVVVVERREPVRVWRNTGPTGNWLAVEVRQPAPNIYAVGGWVEVRLGNKVSRTEITVGGGHASGQMGPHHFGLGGAGQAHIRVVWPDGEASTWERVNANSMVLLERGADAGTSLFPPRD